MPWTSSIGKCAAIRGGSPSLSSTVARAPDVIQDGAASSILRRIASSSLTSVAAVAAPVREKAARDWCDWEDTHVAIRSDHRPDPRYADGPGVPDGLRAPGYPLLASCRVARGPHPATEHRQTRRYPWRAGPRPSGREQPARRALGACTVVAVKRADRCGRGRAFVGRTWHVRNARSRYRSIRTAAIAALSSTRGAELLARVRGSATPDRVDERLQPGADGRHGPVQATATASLSPSSIR